MQKMFNKKQKMFNKSAIILWFYSALLVPSKLIQRVEDFSVRTVDWNFSECIHTTYLSLGLI